MTSRPVLLLLPCNSGVKHGDYMRGQSWKLIYKDLKDLVDSGRVVLGAVECIRNKGIVLHGEEKELVGEDMYPSWDYFKRNPERLDALTEAIARRLIELKGQFSGIVVYLNVKAYRIAVERAVEMSGVNVEIMDIPLTQGGFRSERNRKILRETIERILEGER